MHVGWFTNSSNISCPITNSWTTHVLSLLLLLSFLLLSNSLFSFFLLLFHQRSLSTSLLNSTECFCVPWSWTDHLPRRKASPVASPSVYRMSLLFAPLRSIRKLFLFTGCLCYSSSSDAVFLDGRFLLDADRGNLSLPLRRESLQH